VDDFTGIRKGDILGDENMSNPKQKDFPTWVYIWLIRILLWAIAIRVFIYTFKLAVEWFGK
jgi:hypothetical protein